MMCDSRVFVALGGGRVNDVYGRLAARLDALPHGYPATSTGVELRILRKIFSPEDAELALALTLLPDTAETVARRVARPTEEVRNALERMRERGQIAVVANRGRTMYSLVPFVIGIYELQLHHLDGELAELFEEYAPTLLRSLGGVKPALARVVPVNARIAARATVLRYEDIEALVEDARSFRVAECICRKEQDLLGHSCRHMRETCLAFSSSEDVLAGLATWGRAITRAEALALLARTEADGLVHCTYNVQREPLFICNCCPCCCGFLRGLKEFEAPFVLAPSSVVATIDGERCTACAVCVDRCPMTAIVARDLVFEVTSERCIGCGLCAAGCAASAVELGARGATHESRPPKTLVHWGLERMDERFGRWHKLAFAGRLALRYMATPSGARWRAP
jgi:Na+-translocating ferredoxin:NAD+ oxidoreductase subunit B